MTTLALTALLALIKLVAAFATAWQIRRFDGYIRRRIGAFHERWGEQYGTAMLTYFGILEDDEDDD